MTFTKKESSKQNWPAYNEAQQNEKSRFLALMFDLTRGVPNQERDPHKTGRKPMPIQHEELDVLQKLRGKCVAYWPCLDHMYTM